MALDAVLLAQLAGGLLSLLFTYIPPLFRWYDPLPKETKQAIMGAAIVVVGLAMFGLACGGIDVGFAVVCTQAGLLGVVKVILAALVTNQAVYLLTRK